MSGRAADQRLVGEVQRACAAARDPLDLFRRVAVLVRPRLAYHAAGWILVDADTLLLTGVHPENVTREQHLALIECELAEEDVNRFADLARGDVAAASLSAATHGDLGRSTRYRRVYGPAGLGDELRAVFRSGGTVWGQVCLTRRADQPHFDDDDVDLLARLSPLVADGIRTCPILAGAPEGPPPAGAPASPAVVVLADDGSVESMTAGAERALGPLGDERLETTIAVHEVAQQARLLAEAGHDGPPARARARTRAGDWVVVRGVRLTGGPAGPGRSAVVLEPARRADVATLLLRQRRLTPRERDVTELLLTGMSTAEIAHALWVTPHTLHGYLKSIFAKVGVGSRPELVATLTHEPFPGGRPDGG